jgi:hypothetical protein
MTPDDREQLHLCLIRWLSGPRAPRYGAAPKFLQVCAKSEGFGFTEAEIITELDYLGDATNALGKALVQRAEKLNPALPLYKLTAAGREYAQERGLDQP